MCAGCLHEMTVFTPASLHNEIIRRSGVFEVLSLFSCDDRAFKKETEVTEQVTLDGGHICLLNHAGAGSIPDPSQCFQVSSHV